MVDEHEYPVYIVTFDAAIRCRMHEERRVLIYGSNTSLIIFFWIFNSFAGYSDAGAKENFGRNLNFLG